MAKARYKQETHVLYNIHYNEESTDVTDTFTYSTAFCGKTV